MTIIRTVDDLQQGGTFRVVIDLNTKTWKCPDDSRLSGWIDGGNLYDTQNTVVGMFS